MATQTPCPDHARLEKLLDSSLPEDEQAELIGHLDGCSCCQHSLEELASGGSPCAQMVREAEAGRPPSQSHFWNVMKNLQGSVEATSAQAASGTSEEISLDFLQPAENPFYLGRLGHFDVTEVVGKGGMGIVLKGFDAHLQRFVALKVLTPEFANNENARKRFCREARAAASISHENVVAVHQVEREEGLPFLVMQLVSGESLQEKLDRDGPLELTDILDIGMQTAAGLAAAHAQGLIHRDIKPANILLEGGRKVRLTDFGLARAAEDVKITQTGFVAGTPLYMSPEQARGDEVDFRTDLFSLGSVMYAMCTGKAPFEGSTPYIVLKRVTEEAPERIRKLNPKIPEWLEAGIYRLLEKDPAKRPQSAADIANILAHYLSALRAGTPIAVPCPKQQAPCGTRRRLALIGIPLILGAGLLALELSGITRLTGLVPLPPERTAPVREMGPPPRLTLPANAGPIWSVAISPDGNTIAMGIDDGTVKLWNAKTGEVRGTVHAHKSPIWAVAFSPDGNVLATGSTDGTVGLWKMPSGDPCCKLQHTGPVRCLAFSHDGKKLAAGSRQDRTVIIWDFPPDKANPDMNRVQTGQHDGEVISVAFAADDRTIAGGSGGQNTIKVWDVATGKEKLTIPGNSGGVYAVAYDPNSNLLASGGWDKTVRFWDSTGQQRSTLSGHTQDIWALAFSPDGKILATGSEDRTVKLWDVATGKVIVTFTEHAASVYTVVFSRDGKMLATGSRDGTVKLWDVPSH
jgi:tricorn protease-like protein